MVRPNRRKGIEEVYGTKMEAMQPGRNNPPLQPCMTKTATMRVASSRQADTRTQRSYLTANDYYITTNLPINASNVRNASSLMMAQPSKTSQMPVQLQTTSTQAMPYGPMSNRRAKSNVRQPPNYQPQKVQFMPPENRAQCPPNPHGLNHLQAKTMTVPLQMTQRNRYAMNPDMDTNMVELSDKEHNSVGNLNTRRPHIHVHPNQPQPHPLQHQLHQQQQLNHPINNNMHHVPANNQKLQRQHLLHQQHQQQQQQQHQQHQQHQRKAHSRQHLAGGQEKDDKEDDPEEFFELIRQTVKTAVGATITDLVSRNFRDLSGKMERFSNDLRTTNDNLGKLQHEVSNKVTHYGEENTRHFRYLCMKSEYDKMFYQHQTMINDTTQPKIAQASQVNMPKNVPKQVAALGLKSVKQQMTGRKQIRGNQKKAIKECVEAQNPCACRSTSKPPHQQEPEVQQSSSEHSLTAKSSELGVREVLGQIQRFCTQMQLNDLKDEQPKYNSQTGFLPHDLSEKHSSASAPLNADKVVNEPKAKTVSASAKDLDIEAETPVDSMDEVEIDNFQYSSDEMTSYSDDDSDVKFSGSATARAPIQSARTKHLVQHLNQGAGDG